jgi:OmpA-OmpF porin, OOP family
MPPLNFFLPTRRCPRTGEDLTRTRTRFEGVSRAPPGRRPSGGAAALPGSLGQAALMVPAPRADRVLTPPRGGAQNFTLMIVSGPARLSRTDGVRLLKLESKPMFRPTKAFASSVLGAGLALAALSGPAAAQDAMYWLNEASDCEIFRAMSEVVPAECAQDGDVAVGGLGKTRGITPRGIRLHNDPAASAAVGATSAAVTTPATQQVTAVQQANPPAKKSINARVQFEFDSFDLTDDAKQVLDRLAGVLNDELMLDKVVQIEGHADAAGSDDYNLTLSQLRARAVRAYLIQQHGIGGDRLPFVGKGESEPFDTTNPADPINRRVVFTNLNG